MKKLTAMLLALTMIVAMSSTAFAAEAFSEDKNNYIYVESLDEVDWDNLSDWDVIVVPNSAVKQSGNTYDTLSDKPPIEFDSDIVPQGNTVPSGTWDISEKGQYDFAGYTFDSSYLYTSWRFKGKSSYTVSITNEYTQPLKVAFEGTLRTYRTVSVPQGTTCYTTLSSNNSKYTITADTKWYLRFTAPCEVNGYVK